VKKTIRGLGSLRGAEMAGGHWPRTSAPAGALVCALHRPRIHPHGRDGLRPLFLPELVASRMTDGVIAAILLGILLAQLVQS
jgi:hypothetical protein